MCCSAYGFLSTPKPLICVYSGPLRIAFGFGSSSTPRHPLISIWQMRSTRANFARGSEMCAKATNDNNVNLILASSLPLSDSLGSLHGSRGRVKAVSSLLST